MKIPQASDGEAMTPFRVDVEMTSASLVVEGFNFSVRAEVFGSERTGKWTLSVPEGGSITGLPSFDAAAETARKVLGALLRYREAYVAQVQAKAELETMVKGLTVR